MSDARNATGPTRRHRVLLNVAIGLAVVLVLVVGGGFLVLHHLTGNITTMDPTKALGTDRPSALPKKQGEPNAPVNILLIGSDTRKGQGKAIGGDTPGLSDTTILLHVSANRKLSYGVSLPRDAMVQRPPCPRKGKGNGTDPGGLSQFNEAYAVGGPLCTMKTVEKLTDVHLDHFIVIDFKGFKKMVDALNGVQVCVPQQVDDNVGHIHLPAGTYNVKGERALDYVRVRHDIGTAENGDIGRMKRQQAFLASMAAKALSAGTLVNPHRLYAFLDAATKSITTDPGLGSVNKLFGMGRSLKGIGLDNVQFLTVPFQAYAPDPNRLQWAPQAKLIWNRIRHDQPLGKKFASDITRARTAKPHKAGSGSNASASPSPSSTPSGTAAARKAAENGLCA